MPIELVCGQCQGQFIAEEPGSTVACPHCGTHLQVPGESLEAAAPAEFRAEPQPLELVTSELEAVEDQPIHQPRPESAALVSVDTSLLEEDVPAPATAAAMTTPIEPSASPVVVSTSPAAAVHREAAPASIPLIQTGTPIPPATVPRFWFLVVASYASAMTLAFVFTLLQLAAAKSHQLESLPDVVPKIRNGEVALQIVPPEADVPKGHVLALGESQRYGSVKVTPLRVTQGTLAFEHLLQDPAAVRPPSEPVLKLWLRFENVSRDQKFAPLDPLLLYKRHYGDFGARVLTNQFLCQADQRQRDGNLHHVYELSPTSEFHVAGQKLDTVLEPGAALETFVPSGEQIADLTGDLVWRVQFRKGYHPRTFHGVTTLIDVPFHRRDVTVE
jgi:hypothetical protein